jgi:molecular chaperone GrpE (heat shock protein)
MKCKDAYAGWTAFADILRESLNQGVAAAYYPVVTEALEAVEDELTRLETAKLKESETQYAVLTKKLQDSKADLEQIKNENDKIIHGAQQAAQVVSILTSLLPLLA